jgi:HAD superfamily hydrolase (TIGR01509 family)
MKFPATIGAVLFDMDGLLFDTERIYTQALLEAAAAVGRDMSEAFGHSLIGVSGKDSEAMLQQHFGEGFELTGFRKAYEASKQVLLRDGVPIKTGVFELLQHLEDHRLPRALVTSSGRATTERYLEATGLRSRFACVVTGQDVTRVKPLPDPYQLAAQNLGIRPAHCLVLEDSPNGIRAAHAAGAMPVLVPDVLRPGEEITRLCIGVAANLHEVLNVLRALEA